MKTWVQLSEFEVALDEQIAKIKRITVKKCPMQRCNLSFIDEWTHRWEFYPDSSSHHWAPGPGPFAFLKATSQTMPLKEGSGLRHLDAQTKDLEIEETEANNSKSVLETHEEPSDPLPKKESEKGHSKRDTDLRQIVEPASNEKNDTCKTTTGPEENSLEKLSEITTATKKGKGVAEKSNPATDKVIKTICAASEAPPPMGHHPSGRALPRNIAKSMKGGTE